MQGNTTLNGITSQEIELYFLIMAFSYDLKVGLSLPVLFTVC